MPRCSKINPPNLKICGKREMPLAPKAIMEKEERMKTDFPFMDELLVGKDLYKKLGDWVNKKVEVALKERVKNINN
jgi:hypothetical protein